MAYSNLVAAESGCLLHGSSPEEVKAPPAWVRPVVAGLVIWAFVGPALAVICLLQWMPTSGPLVGGVSEIVSEVEEVHEKSLYDIYSTVFEGAKYVDLTHAFSPSSPVWPGFGGATFAAAKAGADIKGFIAKGEEYTYADHGFEATSFVLTTDQYGTQLDPPAHWNEFGATISDLPATMVLEINVGGQIFHTKRATLLAVEGSLLASMFSGRWEEALDRDKDGRVFLDLDPGHFRLLLNHLRFHRMAEPGAARPLVEEPEHKELFHATVQFLGMSEFLYGPPCCNLAGLDCRKVVAEDNSISVDGHRISGGIRDAEHHAVVGRAPLVNAAHGGSAAWRVSFAKLSPGKDVFAGILGRPIPEIADPLSDSATYGWDRIGLWKAGTFHSDSEVAFQQGDSAIFLLDVPGNRLRMFLERTAQIEDVALEDGIAAQAHLHIAFCAPDTEVVVSPVTADEVSRAGL